MHFRTALTSLFIALVALIPHRAHAQATLQPDTWMLSGLAGVAAVPDASNSVTIAGAAAYPITTRVAIEGELGHVLDMSAGTAAVDTSLTTVHGSALYLFDSDYKLTPYAGGGIGVGKFSVDGPGAVDFSTTEFGFNLGGGVFYPLGGAALFRGDVRFFKHIDNVPSAWRLAGGITVRLGS